MQSKKTFSRHALAIALTSLIGTTYAYADDQAVPSNAQATASTDIKSNTNAQADADTQSITVTTRRRVEKAQDVPAPLTVLSKKDLEAKKLYQVQDLQQALPNVTAQFLHARQSSVAIRGIGSNTANEGLEGSVGLYIDNVYLGRPGQAVFDLLDIQQLDLLRGPQGTLFGRNTTAGVINIVTQKPTFNTEGTLEASGGSRDFEQFRATLNTAISDDLAVRLSAYKTHDDGWVKDVANGTTDDGINRDGARLQFLYDPHSDFNLRLIFEHNQEDSSTGTLVPYSYGPVNKGAAAGNLPIGVVGSNATTYNAYLTGLGAKDVITNPYSYDVSINAPQNEKVNQNSASAEANWNFDGFKLTSISAFRIWDFRPLNDIDDSTLNGGTGGFDTHEKQFSQEIRLASPTGGFYDYVVGAFFLNQDSASHEQFWTGPSGTATLSFPNNAYLNGEGAAYTDSYAVFGQSNFHFTKQFDLTLGLRGSIDKLEGQVIQQNQQTATPLASPYFEAYNTGLLSTTDKSLAAQATSSYKFTDKILGYLTLSNGSKAGGYNVNSVGSPASVLGNDAIKVNPETAKNAELGFKTSWLDDRLFVNPNLFLTKVHDYQAITDTNYNGTFLQELTNVGDLTSKGLELEVKYAPTKDLTFSFNGAHTIAKFDSGTALTPVEDFFGPGGTAGSGYGKGETSIAGNWVNGAPAWLFNADAQYCWHFTDNIKEYLNASYSWRSSNFGDINNSIYSRIPAYAVVNVSTGWLIPVGKQNLDVSIWAKNLFNKHYVLGLLEANNSYYGSAGQPLTVGGTIKYAF